MAPFWPTVVMEEPVCLIDSEEDGRLQVRGEAMNILEQIQQPVVVVAVVGLYRTGKSYLMNRLARKKTGFSLGMTIESKTKGIWMWCIPHPVKAGHTLVLLDTEGLGDVNKGDEKHDTWIFCLAVLLSTTLVYNSIGTIDNNAIEKLHYVSELTEHIKVKSGSSDTDESIEFMKVFPSFVWTVRDFTLELLLDGKSITADEYLENALKLKTGTSPKTDKYNMPRLCIRNFFSPRKCFTLERPASVEKMQRMEKLQDADLDHMFVKQADEFCDYIFNNSKPKTITGGLGVTGRMLGSLAETYVEAIRTGQVPCLDNAAESLAQIQNSRAVKEAFEFYEREMDRWVRLPTDTPQQLSDIHAVSESQAISIFLNGSFNDQDQKHQVELMKRLQAHYEEWRQNNEEESRRVCLSIISRVFASVEKAGREGYYHRPGGYSDYCKALEKATEHYHTERRKGLLSEEVLREYLEMKSGEDILAADSFLTEAQQKAEAERLHQELLERNRRALEEKNLIQEQQKQDQEQSYKQNVQQLLQKIEEERKRAVEEHERVLDAKLKEQRDLLQQGFNEKSEEVRREIERLKEERRKAEPSSARQVMENIGSAVSYVPVLAPFGAVISLLGRLF
ncbi:guanylate-binding protein 1-like [Denticeps clupeoides]|uniref:guanylate-binding protein 1-like n=1 Tax=Denticeps clupeoides TaxID=299321 RepID=UPI0010A4364F|nr:guanylate-binding protein 1-like [Denticeps clupeoides]XP_028819790.1 guanylate-binding protein 1-like [Denticeps clupeoides]